MQPTLHAQGMKTGSAAPCTSLARRPTPPRATAPTATGSGPDPSHSAGTGSPPRAPESKGSTTTDRLRLAARREGRPVVRRPRNLMNDADGPHHRCRCRGAEHGPSRSGEHVERARKPLHHRAADADTSPLDERRDADPSVVSDNRREHALLARSLDDDWDRAAAMPTDRRFDRIPVGDALAVDRDDAVPFLDSARRGGAAGLGAYAEARPSRDRLSAHQKRQGKTRGGDDIAADRSRDRECDSERPRHTPPGLGRKSEASGAPFQPREPRDCEAQTDEGSNVHDDRTPDDEERKHDRLGVRECGRAICAPAGRPRRRDRTP